MFEKECKKCGIKVYGEEEIRKKFRIYSYTLGYKMGTCRKCISIVTTKYNRSSEGISNIMYLSQKRSSRHRKMDLPTYTEDEFKQWLFTNPKFDSLYENWKESGYMKDLKPSVDRLNDYVSYRLDNIQLVTWVENRERSYIDKLNGINNKQNYQTNMYDIDGTFLDTFHSTRYIERELKIIGVYRSCNDHIVLTDGYMWRYVSDGFEIGENIKPHISNTNPINMYDLDGKYIKTFKNINVLYNELKISTYIIRKICNGEVKYTDKYQFRYQLSDNSDINCIEKTNNKRVEQISLDGEYIQTFDSLAHASGSVNSKSQSSISDVCNGHRKTSFGFKWRFENPDDISKIKPNDTPTARKVNMYNLDGSYIKTFISIAEAVRVTGVTGIGNCCNGITKKASEYIWTFGEPKEKVESYVRPKTTDKINIYNLKGEYLETCDSRYVVAERFNLTFSTISNKCKDHGVCGKYQFRYLKDVDGINNITKVDVEVFQRLDKKTNEVLKEYSSIKEAQNDLKLKSASHITSVINGSRKTAYGYKWNKLFK